MFQIKNFLENDDTTVVARLGAFTIVEWDRDVSVNAGSAQSAWFSSQMGVRRRQALCDLSTSGVTVQAGAMQWMAGDVRVATGVKGVGDFFGKALRGAVTRESAIKPTYEGTGQVVLEPTYRHLLLENVGGWQGGLVLEDGLFLACHNGVQQKLAARKNASSAIAGGEGLFNLALHGDGVALLESPVPREELIEVTLQNDVLKIDGPMAVMWSGSLDFTIERTTNTLSGSAASGEGLVNVYRGTGKVLMAPVRISDVFGAALADA